MVELGGDVRSLVAHAQRASLKSGVAVTTAHVLVAMLESRDETARLLEQHGVRLPVLYEGLRKPTAEVPSSIDLVLERALRIAVQSGSRKAHGLHLLLALLQNTRCDAHRGLVASAASVDALRQTLEDSLGLPSRSSAEEAQSRVRAEARPPDARSPLPRTLIDWETQKREQAAVARGQSQTNSEPPTSPAEPPRPNSGRIAGPRAQSSSPRATTARGGDARRLRAVALKQAAKPPAPVASTEAAPAPGEPSQSADAYTLDGAKFPLLRAIGRNLTLEAYEGRLDPVVGRDREIEQVLDVLARRRANNPVLVGPSGVGKTAIVEGIALRMLSEPTRGERDRLVVEISAGSLVSGTSVRGALAEKIARLRKEVQASEGRVLLFIDEIHSLVGGDGPDDLASELKAGLARGELPCIGATTEAEYRRIFERDAALSRRFTRVEVGEPSREATLAILGSVALHYERFHGVAYARDALEAAVDMSTRYLTEQHLPDKALSLLDRAAARARRRGVVGVDRAQIAAVVSDQAGVPVDRLLMHDRERLLVLEERLAEQVIGQRDAIHAVAEAVRKGAVGLRGRRPLGVFLFLGPTGVGKTELAKALSRELFESSGMTRLDMSEYGEPHAVARLFGAPPGYVGHEAGGQLTEAVRKKPYQLILLDELEKAHPDVLLALLPLLDEGRLTDGRGRTVDFTNTVVVMTSNLGVDHKARTRSIGFEGEGAVGTDPRERDATVARVRSALPPELFNRIDEVLCFSRLARDDVYAIARRMLGGVAEALLREQGITLDVGDDAVVEMLVQLGGYDPDLGARPMRRVVGREVESRLARAVLSAEIQRGAVVRLVADHTAIGFVPVQRV
jgi:ATP-dependent Clp protease ATP-binding subunit ClpC